MNKFFLCAFLIPCFVHSQKFSYLGFSLGMDETEIMSLANNHPDLLLEKDMLLVQLIPDTPFSIALVGKDINIKKVFIDTLDRKSYQITVFLNPLYFSFSSLTESLLNKYGLAETQSAYKLTWFDTEKQRRLTLEYPSTVKITDFPTLQRVTEIQNQQLETGISESIDYKNRQRLLDEF